MEIIGHNSDMVKGNNQQDLATIWIWKISEGRIKIMKLQNLIHHPQSSFLEILPSSYQPPSSPTLELRVKYW